jgi:ribosomal protein S12 methylthiotransferase
MKLGVINLGCPKNTVDTEVMLSYLRDFTLTTDPSEADYILINTCGFLKASRDESSGAIADMLKVKKAKVIVAGCFVTKDIENLKKRFTGVHAWVGINDMSNIRKAVEKGGLYLGSAPCVYGGKEHVTLLNPYSAYVKISDGCNHRCSFCTIPSIKGRYRSRKIDDIAAEVKELVDSGVKEINLISQDLTYYGRDNYKKPVLGRLLKAILKKTKKYFWLRLLYLYPDIGVIKDIISVMKNDDRVCRYMDIPFQHVSAHILASMKRGYGPGRIREIIAYSKAEAPGISIRTSFITGYPGETKADLNELEDFIRDGYVEKAGIFAYSDEPGTRAAELKGKVGEKEALRRKKILSLASAQVCYYNNEKQNGKKAEVLVIGKREKGVYLGRTQDNAPDIDNYIIIRSKKPLTTGVFYKAVVKGFDRFDLLGEV